MDRIKKLSRGIDRLDEMVKEIERTLSRVVAFGRFDAVDRKSPIFVGNWKVYFDDRFHGQVRVEFDTRDSGVLTLLDTKDGRRAFQTPPAGYVKKIRESLPYFLKSMEGIVPGVCQGLDPFFEA